ncbi:unnamed protein product [Medioppia subpectinata]|uniref:Uncharacterized protein n=1 Tax=Medioppia subpectinata TaxID=1979941 RepID=A0A7R9QB93_9ACAR|nr:unnamed protein product [Medioppia subpectinata]CAG2117809.1 unnamed protein product [Medioppia subpectinata]
MRVYFIVIFVAVLGLSLAQKRKNRSEEKNCKKDDFDRHSSNVFGQFGLDELSFPETRSQLSVYCKKAKESTEFAKQYGTNCLKSTSQTLMSLATYNFDKVNKAYCAKNGKLKDAWVNWAKCGNQAKPKTTKCWDTMLVTMANAKKIQNSKLRIPTVCCNYYRWIKCTSKALEDMGPSVCSKQAVEGYTAHINKASVDSMNLICSRYEDNPTKCDANFKEVSNTRPKRLDKMPLLYVFDLFDSL